MRTITVLGSTGSIGTNTLDVVRKNRHLYKVYGLAAGQNVSFLAGQISEFRPSRSGATPPRRSIGCVPNWSGQHLAASEWPEMAAGEKALVEISDSPPRSIP